MLYQNTSKGVNQMVAVNQNYFNLNFDYYLPSFEQNNSFLKRIKENIQLFKELYTLRKILKSYFDNLDTFLLIHKLDTLEKIDEVLISLEELSDLSNEVLETTEINRWYNLPIRYMVDKLEDRNMALQGLLLSKQAHLPK